MGVVYKVHHRGWNLDLAVKSPRREMLDLEGGNETFIREAETWVSLGLHPNTVSCYYVRTIGGIPRIFAELVDGGSLAEWIFSGRLYAGGERAALARILDVAIQFAWGLQFAHDRTIVHQDVKPGNVMMTAAAVAKVTDFGLAKAWRGIGAAAPPADTTVMATYAGLTPAYASPEQVAAAHRETGERLTRRTDLWSWAVSVFEMFAGRLPTRAGGQFAREILDSYLRGRSGAVPMPADVADILLDCFELDPARRPATMSEVADRLRDTYARELGTHYTRAAPKSAAASPETLNNRAASLLDLGRAGEALELWDAALRLHPQHVASTYNRALTLWRAARIDDMKALHNLEATRPHDDTSWLAPYLTALLHAERNDQQSAIAVLESIPSPDSDRLEVRRALKNSRERLASSGGTLLTFNETANHATPDGRLLVTSEFHAQTFLLWEVAAQRCTQTFASHEDRITSAQISSDGRRLVSGDYGSRLKVWDTVTGECIHTIRTPDEPKLNQPERHPVFPTISPRGRFGTTWSWGPIHFWDLESGLRIDTIPRFLHFDVRWIEDEDGLVLLRPNAKTIELRDLNERRTIRTFEGHTKDVSAIDISRDGEWIASGGDLEELRIWNRYTGECLRTFDTSDLRTTRVSFTDDRRHLLVAGTRGTDLVMQIRELPTGQLVRAFSVERIQRMTDAFLSADLALFVSGHADMDRMFEVWDVASGRCIRTFNGATGYDRAPFLRLYPDGRALAGPRLWQIGDLRRVESPLALSVVESSEALLTSHETYERELREARTAIDANDLAATVRHIRSARAQPGYERGTDAFALWTGLYGRLPRTSLRGAWHVRTLEGPNWNVHLGRDGRHALTGFCPRHLGFPMAVHRWDIESGTRLEVFDDSRLEKKRWDPLTPRGNVLCLSSDGTRFLTAGGVTIETWDIVTQTRLRAFHFQDKLACALHAGDDGRDLALTTNALMGSPGEAMQLWDVATGSSLLRLEAPATAAAFSPDGRLALSGGGRTLCLWDTATGECLQRTEADDVERILSLDLSRDARYALTGAMTNRNRTVVRLWDLSSGSCIHAIENHESSAYSVHIGDDGRSALTGHQQTMRLWDLATGQCIYTFEFPRADARSVQLSPDARYACCVVAGEVQVIALDWELEA